MESDRKNGESFLIHDNSVDQFITSLTVWVNRDKMPHYLTEHASTMLSQDIGVRAIVEGLGVNIDTMTVDELYFVALALSSQ